MTVFYFYWHEGPQSIHFHMGPLLLSRATETVKPEYINCICLILIGVKSRLYYYGWVNKNRSKNISICTIQKCELSILPCLVTRTYIVIILHYYV